MLSSARFSVTTGSLPVLVRQPSMAWYTVRSATDFFPFSSTLFTSWETSGEEYTGSTMTGRLGAGPLRGIRLSLLRAVATARLFAVLHALGVQRAADDLVTDPRQVLHTTTTHEHDRVLLQVVADPGDVGGHLDLAGQPDT